MSTPAPPVRLSASRAVLDGLSRGEASGDSRIAPGGITAHPVALIPGKAGSPASLGHHRRKPVTLPQTTSATPTISTGARGSAVTHAQFLLRVDGVSVGIDGDFGPETTTAVQNFQREFGLTVDGVVGPVTSRGDFDCRVVDLARLQDAHFCLGGASGQLEPKRGGSWQQHVATLAGSVADNDVEEAGGGRQPVDVYDGGVGAADAALLREQIDTRGRQQYGHALLRVRRVVVDGDHQGYCGDQRRYGAERDSSSQPSADTVPLPFGIVQHRSDEGGGVRGRLRAPVLWKTYGGARGPDERRGRNGPRPGRTERKQPNPRRQLGDVREQAQAHETGGEGADYRVGALRPAAHRVGV